LNSIADCEAKIDATRPFSFALVRGMLCCRLVTHVIPVSGTIPT